MGLAERLGLLRGSAPSQPSPPQAPAPDIAPGPESDPGPTLAERLARLRPASASGGPLGASVAAKAAPTGIEALGGDWVAPGVLRVERRVPLAQVQGRVTLGAGLAGLAWLAERVLGHTGDPEDWCLLDTETSGLAGGTGTWVFACGLARPEGQTLVLRQYLLTRLDAEAGFLAALHGALDGCRLLVSYNGKSFDLPLLTTRYRLAGMTPDWADAAHLDLLHPVRRAFAPVWPDCRLGTVEDRLLGLKRQGDLPGSEAPRAWLAWLRRGETAGLAGVLSHNRLDLLSLAALGAPLALALSDPARVGADPLAVAGWHRDRGDPDQARAILEAQRQALTPVGVLELARYRARARDWGGARDLLAPLAEAGHPEALAALAILWEHRLGDPARALDLAQRLPPGPERERRCRRLEERLGPAQGRSPGPAPTWAIGG